MARKYSSRTVKEIKAMMGEDGEFLRPMVRAVIQESSSQPQNDPSGSTCRQDLRPVDQQR